MKAAIIVGHTSLNKGARAYSGIYEYQFNSLVAEAISIRLVEHGIDHKVLHRSAGPWNHTLSEVSRQVEEFGADLSVELHFNAFNKRTPILGSECLLHDYTDRPLGDRLLTAIRDTYGIEPRSLYIVKKKARGYNNLHKMKIFGKVKYAVLIEPCFADVEHKDSTKIIENPERYGRVLADAINEFSLEYQHEREKERRACHGSRDLETGIPASNSDY